MLIPTTIVQSQGGGGGWTLIQEIIAPSGGSASIDFTGIAGTYRDLKIEWVAQTENAAAQNLFARLNNDSGGNYAWAQVDPQNATTATQTAQTEGLVGVVSATGDTYPVSGEITIVGYKGTVLKKVVRGQANGFYSTANRQIFQHFLWDSTAAITRITIFAASDIKEGSEFRLYGIT